TRPGCGWPAGWLRAATAPPRASPPAPRRRRRPRSRGSRLLLRAPPAVHGALLAAGQGELAFGRVAGDHRTGADGGARADRHRREQRAVGADEGAVADGGGGLVHAVVVAGDGAGADVDLRADARVAQVGEVVGLAARAERRVLGLDEIADVHAFGEHRARAQP